MGDIAVIGPAAIIENLPRLLARIRETARAAVASDADAVVIIDAPEFTHRVARKIRGARPGLPIIDYVSPSVWAWRPGRAARMRAVHRRSPGAVAVRARGSRPARRTTVHLCRPSADRAPPVDQPRSRAARRASRSLSRAAGAAGAPRQPARRDRAAVRAVRGDARRTARRGPSSRRHCADDGERRATWSSSRSRTGPFPTHVIEDEVDKFRAFKLARAALAASGTVTLELALAGCPMVVAYKVDTPGAAVPQARQAATLRAGEPRAR